MGVLHNLHNPLVQGALAGWLSAAGADLAAFRSWKSFDDAAHYDWKVAIWRWFQGTLLGVLSGAGFAGLGALG
jgi:hypothetical protein